MIWPSPWGAHTRALLEVDINGREGTEGHMIIIDKDGRAEQWIFGVMLLMHNIMLTLF